MNGGKGCGTMIGRVKQSISHIFPLCNTCIACVWMDAFAVQDNVQALSLDGFSLDLQIMLLESIPLFFLVIHFAVYFLKDA